MLEKGLVQIYTGSGKGKTTAALGLSVRAAGHGAKVLIYQFLKPQSLDCGERVLFGDLKGVTVKLLDEPWDMYAGMDDKTQVERVKKSICDVLAEVETACHEHYFDICVLDELVYCYSKGLACFEDIERIIKHKHSEVEVVLTGRGADEKLIGLADLVTEMREIKHPMNNGVKARKGIEY